MTLSDALKQLYKPYECHDNVTITLTAQDALGLMLLAHTGMTVMTDNKIKMATVISRAHAVVEQHRVLRHDADRAAQACLPDFANIRFVDQDASVADIVKAVQQARQR